MNRPQATSEPADRVAAARRAVAANPSWYHTIELAQGVVSPGQVDMRKVAASLLPADLSGKRALDIGTFDGFWAFELERRGAEVVAIDTDTTADNEWPPLNRARLERLTAEHDVELGRGFRLASEALASRVERRICNVYDLSPEVIGGPVDVAFAGTIMLHLRDPVGALERIWSTLVPGGTLLAIEPFSPISTALAPRRPFAELQTSSTDFNWWFPNLAALREWQHTAGFVAIRRRGFHRPPSTKPMRQWYTGLECRRPGTGRAVAPSAQVSGSGGSST